MINQPRLDSHFNEIATATEARLAVGDFYIPSHIRQIQQDRPNDTCFMSIVMVALVGEFFASTPFELSFFWFVLLAVRIVNSLAFIESVAWVTYLRGCRTAAKQVFRDRLATESAAFARAYQRTLAGDLSSRHFYSLVLLGCITAVIDWLLGCRYFTGPACYFLALSLQTVRDARVPPTMLFLATSTDDAWEALIFFRCVFAPYRIVALLDGGQTTNEKLPIVDRFDNLRTGEQSPWFEIVREVESTTPIVIVDTRHYSGGLEIELVHLAKLARRGKVFFLGNPDGTCPAIEQMTASNTFSTTSFGAPVIITNKTSHKTIAVALTSLTQPHLIPSQEFR